MRGRRLLAIALATTLAVAMIPVSLGVAWGSSSEPSGSDDRASVSAKPQSSRYQSKVGAFTRVILKTGAGKGQHEKSGVS